jgi:hypothetical protein
MVVVVVGLPRSGVTSEEERKKEEGNGSGRGILILEAGQEGGGCRNAWAQSRSLDLHGQCFVYTVGDKATINNANRMPIRHFRLRSTATHSVCPF